MTTRAERAVLDALADETTFRSAQDIHGRLRAAGSRIGLTSVYRAVQALSESGELDVRRSAAGEATYRRCASRAHHHHLVCRTCGATVEVEAPSLERWIARVAGRHGYRVDAHTVELVGECAACARPRTH
jgi:Fur family ferric uptake transcriptional regulator